MSKFIDLGSAIVGQCGKMLLEGVVSTFTFDASMEACDRGENIILMGKKKYDETYAEKHIVVKRGLFKTRYFDTKKNIEVNPSEEIKNLLKQKRK